MSKTRSLGIQVQGSKSTAVQTKRLSKEELRYYTKIVEKEKQILLKFMKVTTEYPALRQPHYRINLAAPTGTNLRKSFGAHKKRKNKKHASHKTKGKTKEDHNGEQDNAGHYVSKIVVDDATHCLKLRVRSCRKGQGELKESNSVVPERARSRKAKQPRRYINKSLESLTEMENFNDDDIENEWPQESNYPSFEENRETPSPNEEIKLDVNDLAKKSTSLTTLPTQATSVKVESKNTDCQFAKRESRDHFSSVDSSQLPRIASQIPSILPPVQSVEKSPNGQATSSDPRAKLPDPQTMFSDPQATSLDSQATSSDESNYHSPNEDSDDNQSVCSEEFFIVETKEDKLSDGKEATRINGVSETRDKPTLEETIKSNQETFTNLKDELKRRLKANLVRKTSDSQQNEYNMINNDGNTAKALPQVVSVHFYDPQTHSQRVVGADTHIQYHSSPIVRHTSTALPYPKSPSTTLPYQVHLPQRQIVGDSLTTSRPPNLSQATLPTNYPYSSYYSNNAEIHKQHPAYQIPSIHPSTRVRTVIPEISSNITSREVVSSYSSHMPSQAIPNHTETSRGVALSNASVSRSHPPETHRDSVTASEVSTSNTNVTTDVRPAHPELTSSSIHKDGNTSMNPIENENRSEFTGIDIKAKKRKRFIFGSHEPPRKKVISSLLTPLCEREATKLADGIHEINMQYFPLRSLAQKAANRVSGDTDDVLKLIDQKIQLKTKIQDVEKARNLLKDIYDMVLKSKEIEDIQNFELVSHNFGVRNILNHLSLVDLYFGELGSELESKI